LDIGDIGRVLQHGVHLAARIEHRRMRRAPVAFFDVAARPAFRARWCTAPARACRGGRFRTRAGSNGGPRRFRNVRRCRLARECIEHAAPTSDPSFLLTIAA
jgi:hypothetical protein